MKAEADGARAAITEVCRTFPEMFAKVTQRIGEHTCDAAKVVDRMNGVIQVVGAVPHVRRYIAVQAHQLRLYAASLRAMADQLDDLAVIARQPMPEWAKELNVGPEADQ